MSHVKRKDVFKHVQNAHIQIHTAQSQSYIQEFALHWYTRLCPMILLADTEDPDQIALIRAFAFCTCSDGILFCLVGLVCAHRSPRGVSFPSS